MVIQYDEYYCIVHIMIWTISYDSDIISEYNLCLNHVIFNI